MQELRRSLPAYKEKEALLNAISRNQVFFAYMFYVWLLFRFELQNCGIKFYLYNFVEILT